MQFWVFRHFPTSWASWGNFLAQAPCNYFALYICGTFRSAISNQFRAKLSFQKDIWKFLQTYLDIVYRRLFLIRITVTNISILSVSMVDFNLLEKLSFFRKINKFTLKNVTLFVSVRLARTVVERIKNESVSFFSLYTFAYGL